MKLFVGRVGAGCQVYPMMTMTADPEQWSLPYFTWSSVGECSCLGRMLRASQPLCHQRCLREAQLILQLHLWSTDPTTSWGALLPLPFSNSRPLRWSHKNHWDLLCLLRWHPASKGAYLIYAGDWVRHKEIDAIKRRITYSSWEKGLHYAMPPGEVPGFDQEAEEGMKGKPSPELFWGFRGKDKVGQSKQLRIG